MNVQLISVGKLRVNPNNPRVIRDEKFKKLIKSIKDFPEMLRLRPIVYSSDGVILGGNMRFEAQKAAGHKEVWAVCAEGLTEEQKREFIIKDNVGFGDWDHDVLANEWDANLLTEWAIDLPVFEVENEATDKKYSPKVGEVIYEPKTTEHEPWDLFTKETRFDTDINLIENEGIKEMLKARAAFFSTFNFSKIADYYAYQATKDEQAIFEKLALVILDKDRLIENGFAKLIETVKELNGFNENEELSSDER